MHMISTSSASWTRTCDPAETAAASLTLVLPHLQRSSCSFVRLQVPSAVSPTGLLWGWCCAHLWRHSSTCMNLGNIAVLPLQDVLGFLDLQDIVGSFMRTLDLPRLRAQSLAQCMADLEAAGRDFSARQLAGLEELGEAAPVPFVVDCLVQPTAGPSRRPGSCPAAESGARETWQHEANLMSLHLSQRASSGGVDKQCLLAVMLCSHKPQGCACACAVALCAVLTRS